MSDQTHAQPQSPAQDRLLSGLIIAAFVAISLQIYPGSSADFIALWSAGKAFATGQFGNIYASPSDIFLMLPPEAWNTGEGLRALYPFIYPPLWAWVMETLTQIASFETTVLVLTIINTLSIAGMFVLTHRIMRPDIPLWRWLLVGLVISSVLMATFIAQLQSQPQIIVSFLTVLALERSFAGRPAAAGIAMAIAASIKLYPLIFALIWLFAGRRTEAVWFFVIGALCALTSLLVAGWPLHAEFLGHISAISNTALLTSLVHGIDPMIAQLFYPGNFVQVTPDFLGPGDKIQWAVASKPLWHTLLNKAALLTFIAVSVLALRKEANPHRQAAVWPVLMGVFGLIGPISWAYHYLAVFAFLPMFLMTLHRWQGWTALLLCLLALSPATYVVAGLNYKTFNLALPLLSPIQIIATLGIAALSYLFWRNLQKLPSSM